MRKIKEIQADIKEVRATARAAIAKLQQEAQAVREHNANDKANAAANKAWLASYREADKANKQMDKDAKALAAANARLAKRQTLVELHCTM